MGTSRSSSGSPSGVPLVPPWVPDQEKPPVNQPPEKKTPPDANAPAAPPQATPPVLAPAARFRGTRQSLGSFAKSGSRSDLQRGVGRYVRTGLGGTRTAVTRFGGTSRTAGRLYGVLGGGGAVGAAPPSVDALDPVNLASRSGKQIIAVVIEAVAPVDGTQDTEASRAAINDALSETLKRHPDADLLKLTESQREFAIECFVAIDVYRRFVLDVGNAIRDKAPSASTALARLKEAREYISEVISSEFRKLHEAGSRLNTSRVTTVVRTALRNALAVFEEYAE